MYIFVREENKSVLLMPSSVSTRFERKVLYCHSYLQEELQRCGIVVKFAKSNSSPEQANPPALGRTFRGR